MELEDHSIAAASGQLRPSHLTPIRVGTTTMQISYFRSDH